ncbi:MAG: HPr family phosphocarrier protein [Lachnospiraceae bacterium]|nr:HPr family phosphocarrier protein [Lachnospiraceae bacterium]
MVSKKVTILSETGLHLRPAAQFAQEACKYQSSVTFTAGDYKGSAKSVLSVLAGCVKCGDTILIECSGVDEEEALNGMCAVVAGGLGDKKE